MQYTIHGQVIYMSESFRFVGRLPVLLSHFVRVMQLKLDILWIFIQRVQKKE